MMPGPVSDSYDPEWGTRSNAEPILNALEKIPGDKSLKAIQAALDSEDATVAEAADRMLTVKAKHKEKDADKL